MNNFRYGVGIINYKDYMRVAAYCFMNKIKYDYDASTCVVYFIKEEHQETMQKLLGRA